MSRFNINLPTGRTATNSAGAPAYAMSKELELVSLLLTSFATDSFYKSADQKAQRLTQLLQEVDPLFAAKALVFARDEFGMRSITHIGGAVLATRVSGQPWGTAFYDALVVRPDDMTETLAYLYANNLKLTNAMKKGFARAFSRLNPYQIAKYRGEGKGINLMDVANLVHPKQSERNNGALAALMKGELKNEDTWESRLSAAGSDAAKKKAVWADLLGTNKLGYFALLRNLRNIAQQAPESLDLALHALKSPTHVGKARVLPFRYATAYDELKGASLDRERDILWAIDEAAELALGNVPVLPGKTLVALDVSGSMTSNTIGTYHKRSCAQVGALFAATLAQANKADMLTFDTGFYWNTVERMGVLPFARSLKSPGGGTDFNQVFLAAQKPYDRIIILSDNEAWRNNNGLTHVMGQYRKHFGIETKLWCFDLAGNGTLQFPQNNSYFVAGFSEKVFDIMAQLEEDRNALLNRVKAYEFESKEEPAPAE